jgi:hypothetical protein
MRRTVSKDGLNPLEHPDWDAALARRPDFSFFHGAAWTRVLVETYGFTPLWQAGTGPAERPPLLPLMEADSWLRGRRAIALPFTDECPPLCEAQEDCRPLFQAAKELGRARGWKTIEVRGGRDDFPEAPASLAYHGHSLSLGADEAKLFERMDGPARQAVRKAEKDGVTVELSATEDATRAFYRLQCLTRKRHGLPPQPLDFFLNIWRFVLSQNQGIVALARWQDQVVAGAVYFFLAGRAVYKFGASDLRWQQLRPNNVVMWEAMKWLAHRGVTTLSLGKTALNNDGLRRFKLRLGAVEKRIEYVKFDLRRNHFIVEQDGIEGWHNRVFRRLPVFAARRAGELLYKHWA